MNKARAELDRSIEATKAALSKMAPAQIDQVLDQTRTQLEAFIRNEWLYVPPSELLAIAKRRAAAEAFRAIVRVPDFGRAA